MKSVVIACLVAYASAAWKCTPGDYEIYLKAFAQGFQADTNSQNTDCYRTTQSFAGRISNTATAVRNFQSSDWLAPVYELQETLVELTTVFSDCQSTNAAKQLITRTTQFSGLFEMFGTVGAAYARESKNPGQSPLYNAYKAWPTSSTCEAQAKNTALIISAMLNF